MSKKSTFIRLGTLAVLVLAANLTLHPVDSSKVKALLSESVHDDGDERAVARLGDLSMSTDELKALFANLPIDDRKQLAADRPLLQAWIRKRMAEKSVLAQASVQNWSQRPDVQQKIQTAKEQIIYQDFLLSVSQVPQDYPSAAELQKAYDAGKSNWMTAERFRVAQIFIPLSSKESVETVRRKALDVSKKAQNHPGGFAALVSQYSQDPGSAKNAGDIGLQSLEHLLPAVRLTVARLKVGEVSDPVQSLAGFHVIKLLEVQKPRVATLDEVRADLTRTLRRQRQHQLVETYLSARLNAAPFNLNDKPLDKVVEGAI
ncbi:peptidylprolyl isomerase [Pseudomonas sp. ITA]|uniref:peptidylprolyl isomerase n=1 Tax=Pseudomonas sp. ITA TaxID=2825841 RepID=UPI0024999103|nr:peptidylprolyl isomerase [Pseudomonas sp. ITA]MDI2146172.1 peptidylprolyl isomerase [Pseudomonas sp. ITA]